MTTSTSHLAASTAVMIRRGLPFLTENLVFVLVSAVSNYRVYAACRFPVEASNPRIFGLRASDRPAARADFAAVRRGVSGHDLVWAFHPCKSVSDKVPAPAAPASVPFLNFIAAMPFRYPRLEQLAAVLVILKIASLRIDRDNSTPRRRAGRRRIGRRPVIARHGVQANRGGDHFGHDGRRELPKQLSRAAYRRACCTFSRRRKARSSFE